MIHTDDVSDDEIILLKYAIFDSLRVDLTFVREAGESV